jgi:hypothetical protein
MKNLIVVALLLLANLAYGQTAADENNAHLDNTLNYIKQVTSISTKWANNPEKAEFRKLLSDEVKKYEQIKNDFTMALIDMSVDKDKSIDLIYKLEQINEYASVILVNFKDKKSLDDATSVLMNQELVESDMTPLSKELSATIASLKK